MYQAAHQFIDLLSEGNICSFQTFDDSKESQRKRLIKVLHGSLDQNIDKLIKLNEDGAGIFVMVNQGDGKGRAGGNVTNIRSVFIDLDGSPIQPVLDAPIKPQIIIATSPNKYHAYWLVNDLDKEHFKPLQQLIARDYGGDMKVCDLPRVMRIPDFFHKKNDPFKVRIHQINDIPRYTKDEIYKAFGFDPSLSNWKDSEKIPEGNRNNEMFTRTMHFVKQGHTREAIERRMETLNQKLCVPPLDDSELRGVINSALSYDQGGTLTIEYSLFDSYKFQSLPNTAKLLYITILRMLGDLHERDFSLIPKDLAGLGFKDPKTLRKYKEELIAKGFIHCSREPQYGKSGQLRVCGLYKLNKKNDKHR